MNIHEETAMRCWMLCHPPEQIERSEGETIEMIADLLERIYSPETWRAAERHARGIEHNLNPGEISDEASYLRRLVTSDISLEECQQKLKQLELEIEAACQFCCGYCKNKSVADAYRDPSNNSWYHLTLESSTGRWYCAASPIRERRYQRNPRTNETQDVSGSLERTRQLETLIEDYAKFCGHLPMDAGQGELQWRAYELLRPEETKHAG